MYIYLDYDTFKIESIVVAWLVRARKKRYWISSSYVTRRSRTRTKGEVHWANNIDRNIVGGTRLGLNQRYRWRRPLIMCVRRLRRAIDLFHHVLCLSLSALNAIRVLSHNWREPGRRGVTRARSPVQRVFGACARFFPGYAAASTPAPRGGEPIYFPPPRGHGHVLARALESTPLVAVPLLPARGTALATPPSASSSLSLPFKVILPVPGTTPHHLSRDAVPLRSSPRPCRALIGGRVSPRRDADPARPPLPLRSGRPIYIWRDSLAASTITPSPGEIFMSNGGCAETLVSPPPLPYFSRPRRRGGSRLRRNYVAGRWFNELPSETADGSVSVDRNFSRRLVAGREMKMKIDGKRCCSPPSERKSRLKLNDRRIFRRFLVIDRNHAL